ncbi:MAG: phenylalanine--tRNA ligase beta subunit-related protein [Acidobacteriota bacterium]
MIRLGNAIAAPEALLGVVVAETMLAATTTGLEAARATVLERRRAAPTPTDERVRQAVRDLLRRGRYKPTGRGKPASEYLLRTAQEGVFPSIHPAVDAANLVSLESLLPISLWDLDRAHAASYVFRAGRPGEAYVFNAGGQTIDLEDLLIGCAVGADGSEVPCLSPVKDSLATKTAGDTRRMAAVLYAPLAERQRLEEATAMLHTLLAACTSDGNARSGRIEPGATAEI